MPFEVPKTKKKLMARRRLTGVKLSRYKSSSCATISMGNDVLMKSGWAVGMRVEFLVGTQKDYGQILVRPHPDGVQICSNGAKDQPITGAVISCGRCFDGLPEISRAQCTYSFSQDQGLFISIPQQYRQFIRKEIEAPGEQQSPESISEINKRNAERVAHAH